MTTNVYTHGHAESVLRSHRSRTAASSAAYLLPYLAPGQSLLDIGCGPATITADFVGLVAPGTVTATETDEPTLDLARQELARRGLTGVELTVADVHGLPFEDHTFDVVHAHQVLQHVADPVLALREMRRVCKPGGVVAARDADYAAFTWYPASSDLDAWLRVYREAAQANHAEPDAGRRLLAWAHAAGFDEVTATSSTWCYADPAGRAFWGGMWADRILGSDLTRQLLREERATRADLERIADAWRAWVAEPDGWFSILHGEIIGRA